MTKNVRRREFAEFTSGLFAQAEESEAHTHTKFLDDEN